MTAQMTSQECPVCNRPIGFLTEDLLQRHIDLCLGLVPVAPVAVKCELCLKDITHFTPARRTQHVNKCCEAADKVHGGDIRSKTYYCVICNRDLCEKTLQQRVSHLKSCKKVTALHAPPPSSATSASSNRAAVNQLQAAMQLNAIRQVSRDNDVQAIANRSLESDAVGAVASTKSNSKRRRASNESFGQQLLDSPVARVASKSSTTAITATTTASGKTVNRLKNFERAPITQEEEDFKTAQALSISELEKPAHIQQQQENLLRPLTINHAIQSTTAQPNNNITRTPPFPPSIFSNNSNRNKVTRQRTIALSSSSPLRCTSTSLTVLDRQSRDVDNIDNNDDHDDSNVDTESCATTLRRDILSIDENKDVAIIVPRKSLWTYASDLHSSPIPSMMTSVDVVEYLAATATKTITNANNYNNEDNNDDNDNALNALLEATLNDDNDNDDDNISNNNNAMISVRTTTTTFDEFQSQIEARRQLARVRIEALEAAITQERHSLDQDIAAVEARRGEQQTK